MTNNNQIMTKILSHIRTHCLDATLQRQNTRVNLPLLEWETVNKQMKTRVILVVMNLSSRTLEGSYG